MTAPGRTAGRRVRLRNLTRGTELGGQIEVAGDAASRRKGLLGRDALAPGQGLWIAPCEAVHTIGMRFSIDLVYLDRKLRVRKTRAAVAPWRFSACLTAFSVVELPAGTLAASGTVRGDQLAALAAEPAGNAP